MNLQKIVYNSIVAALYEQVYNDIYYRVDTSVEGPLWYAVDQKVQDSIRAFASNMYNLNRLP